MKATPLFLGACAFASIAGAVGGATTNTSPIQRGGIGSEMLPGYDFDFDESDDGLPQAAPPDHYAMTTPEGRVEIAELSTRGLYAQQRFGWRTASYELPPEPVFDDLSADWSEPASEVRTAPAPAEPQPAAQPEAEAPAPQGEPRIVDVAATLAARDDAQPPRE